MYMYILYVYIYVHSLVEFKETSCCESKDSHSALNFELVSRGRSQFFAIQAPNYICTVLCNLALKPLTLLHPTT